MKRWRNYNSFEARLLAKDICNCSLHGLWAFRMALEDPTYYWGPAELLLDVAIDWLEIAGDKLLTSNEEWDPSSPGDDSWSGYPGFCAERWNLWARRLDEASGNVALNAEVRTRADWAARTIDAAYPR
ncbi:hypothetical protein BDV97DRAFT_26388 [Delphinella strobiligena]|nr:hypothetical protein BDV97DRAFT_26388 [Delphinella strobiligena]